MWISSMNLHGYRYTFFKAMTVPAVNYYFLPLRMIVSHNLQIKRIDEVDFFLIICFYKTVYIIEE